VRFPLARGVQIALDLASALAFAHRQRIVHRDVKPANVFLHQGADGTMVPKLVDFGISRFLDHAAESLTVTQLVVSLKDSALPKRPPAPASIVSTTPMSSVRTLWPG